MSPLSRIYVRFGPGLLDVAEELRKRLGATDLPDMLRGLVIVEAMRQEIPVDAVREVPGWSIKHFRIHFGRPPEAGTV